MKKSEAIKFFGNISRIAEALGVTRASVSQWGDKIPKARQEQIEVITKGQLKRDLTPWEKLQQEASQNGQG